MTAISIRRRLASPRRRVLAIMATLALAASVVAHHGGSMETGMHGMSGGLICLAVLGGAVAVGIAGAVSRMRVLRPTGLVWHPSWSWVAPPLTVPSRASPLFVRHQCLRR